MSLDQELIEYAYDHDATLHPVSPIITFQALEVDHDLALVAANGVVIFVRNSKVSLIHKLPCSKVTQASIMTIDS